MKIIHCKDKTFEIGERIGKGSYGNVFRCTDELKEVYAAKEIPFRGKGTPCVMEIAILSTFNHEYIVNLLWRYASAYEVYMLQPLGDCDLYDYIHQRGAMVDTAKDLLFVWFNQLLQALACLHRYEIIHGDIKPSNVIVYGNNIKLADFTLSVQKPSKNTRYTHTAYTITYRAPEVLEGNWSTPADIWAMGCVFYEMAYACSAFKYQGDHHTDEETDQLIRRTLAHIAVVVPYKTNFNCDGEHTKPSVPWPDDETGNVHVNSIVNMMIQVDENIRNSAVYLLDIPIINQTCPRVKFKVTMPVSSVQKQTLQKNDGVDSQLKNIVKCLYDKCKDIHMNETVLLNTLMVIVLKISGYGTWPYVRDFYKGEEAVLNELLVLKHLDFRVISKY